MNYLFKDDPELGELVAGEEKRIENTINLIAAENHMPLSVLETAGSVFNAKTIEGYPGARFHSGCVHADKVERLAIDRAKALFGAEYANVQPHSGTSANLAVYFSVLKPGDRVLAMSLPHGGHLSHGHRASITSQCFSFEHYGVDEQTERIDYDHVRDVARRFLPKLIVAGASSYPRLIDYEQMAHIAQDVGALLMADMAHIAGLVAAKVIPSPVPFCDFVTFTCYKTMMGGRGGIILARDKFSRAMDRTIFPGCQGTSPVSMIGAKALIFHIAAKPFYIQVQKQTIGNAKALAAYFGQNGYHVVTGGTDNHQVVLDLSGNGVSGAQAESVLESAGILLNRNVVPKDAGSPGRISGVRIGTAAVATRGMGINEMHRIGGWIHEILKKPDDSSIQQKIKSSVAELCRQFPVYHVE